LTNHADIEHNGEVSSSFFFSAAVRVVALFFVSVSFCHCVMAEDRVAVAAAASYQVSVTGHDLSVYGARTLDAPFNDGRWNYGGDYAFANFDMAVPVTVRITSSQSLLHVVVRPEFPEIKVHVESEHVMTITFAAPRKISIEPDGKHQPLLLFGNPPDAVVSPGPGVVYFGPGFHDVGQIRLTNNQTLYLAADAVVKGGIVADGQNIRIVGRGILDSSEYAWGQGPSSGVIALCGTNLEINGITIRGASRWTVVPRNSRQVVIRNLKICGSRVQNDDGIDVCNSQDVLVTDCFIRSDDDCVALKGLELTPDANVEHVVVTNCTLWCDRARIFLLGHESRAPFMRDIRLQNLDIIHFTMTPFLFQPGEEMRLEDVRVDDVRLHGEGQHEVIRVEPVINQYMRKQVPGHVDDIQFSNLRLTGAEGEYAIYLHGHDNQHLTQNVRFENINFLGQAVTNGSRFVKIFGFTENISLPSAGK
jgi:hypothetical protein